MPADATTLLTSIEAELAALYPNVPCKVRKLPPAPSRPPLSGWMEGDPNELFILSAGDPEEIDAEATFEEVSVGHPVEVAYVKRVAPGDTADDETVRDTRQAVRRRLYKPRVTDLPTVFAVTQPRGQVYEAAAGSTLIASSQVFTFTLTEARAE